MRTTLNIDADLIGKVSKLSGIKDKAVLVRLGLETLIARESRKRLSKKTPLAGTILDIKGAFPVKAKIKFEKLRSKMKKINSLTSIFVYALICCVR